ncbi:MAG: hypothetical protein WCH98_04730 [Verrucomicrobiota bacterium]
MDVNRKNKILFLANIFSRNSKKQAEKAAENKKTRRVVLKNRPPEWALRADIHAPRQWFRQFRQTLFT